MLGPRTTLSFLVDLSHVYLLFGVVTLLSSSSSQSREWVVLLQCVVVGLQTIESGIRGWVCLRKSMLEATILAFSLS